MIDTNVNVGSFREKLKEYINVLKMTRKPDREEFLMTAKVAIAVMFTIGFLGFVIYLLMDVLPGALR
ncbi:protein translocase SEC61 complex subunit gamma [Archaeoglobus veneficus]|uniref:Protein translocase subunit SecE n=1 Tax=Archaeoglobus veneficus (strain DSM 11195 / SNP6) TaxID=693661 RepID=F2KQ66_ARCVS|nr:protein translocase SEC61 complex subunit gamma [Archaeoglobus veneficus]AEA47669.1 Preprotein translocase subunit secE [Archaeoglobus veneficus SNP6]